MFISSSPLVQACFSQLSTSKLRLSTLRSIQASILQDLKGFHCSVLPICHSLVLTTFKLPFTECFQASILQDFQRFLSSVLPRFHSSVLPSFHSSVLPSLHYFRASLLLGLPIFHFSKLPFVSTSKLP